MPVSHIGLTVSHLPTSCSFFLAALQPLGYHYIGKYGNQIGLGVVEADFFLTQETPGVKAGAAHVAFSAPSRAAVRNFYANALEAGGSPHGSPAAREDGEDIFNAAVFDCDGNSVEVVFHEDGAFDDGASYSGQSRVLTLRQDVGGNVNDSKSTVSTKSAVTSATKKALMPANSVTSRSNRAPSVANSTTSKATSRTIEVPQVKRSFTAPTLSAKSSDDTIQISRKTLVGTILGAAAGAAVAYAMCKSEEDSARLERAWNEAQNQASQQISKSLPRPKIAEAASDPQPVYSSPPRSVLNASEVESYFGGQYMQPRAIEPPPPSGYQHPSYTTVFTGQQPDKMSTASRSRVSFSRAMSMPEERQQTPSRVQSTLISSFAPSEPMREPSDHRSSPSHSPTERRSSHSSKSQASEHKSSTSSSKHSSSGRKHRSKSRRGSSASRTASPVLDEIPETRRNVPSSRTSVLGRSVVDYPEDSPYPSSSEQDTGNDTDTVVPSDSISCVGSSRRSHRPASHLSQQLQQQSIHSSPPQQQQTPQQQFSARTPSSTSTHSKRDDSRRASEAPSPSPPSSSHISRSMSKSKRASSDVTGKKKRRDSKDVKVVRPDFIEEAESGDEESTMTPGKYSKYGANLGRSGGGSEAHSLPIRGITQSMVDGHAGGRRGVASYAG